MRVLLMIPPLTQLNTPYPATAYLTGFLRKRGVAAFQADPAIELVLRLLSRKGLQEMKTLIKELKRAGKTVLLSSHQLADVEDVCDRVCILYRGKLEVEGTVDSLLEVQDVFKVEARNVPAEVQQQVVSMLQHSAGVSEVQPGVQRSRLQDLFNRLVLNKRAAERAAK